MEKYEAIAVKEMFKEFYQWMVDSNRSYNWEQEDEKVLLLYIVNYNLLQMMVVVDIGYYSKQVDYLAILQSVSVSIMEPKRVEEGGITTKIWTFE